MLPVTMGAKAVIAPTAARIPPLAVVATPTIFMAMGVARIKTFLAPPYWQKIDNFSICSRRWPQYASQNPLSWDKILALQSGPSTENIPLEFVLQNFDLSFDFGNSFLSAGWRGVKLMGYSLFESSSEGIDLLSKTTKAVFNLRCFLLKTG